MSGPAPLPSADELKALLLGACVRGDREALRASLPDLAARNGLTVHAALATLIDWMMLNHCPNDPEPIPVADLERLPDDILENVMFEIARVVCTNAPTPSRAH